MAIVIPLVEFDICSLELKYVNCSHNSWICNLRIRDVILIIVVKGTPRLEAA